MDTLSCVPMRQAALALALPVSWINRFLKARRLTVPGAWNGERVLINVDALRRAIVENSRPGEVQPAGVSIGKVGQVVGQVEAENQLSPRVRARAQEGNVENCLPLAPLGPAGISGEARSTSELFRVDRPERVRVETPLSDELLGRYAVVMAKKCAREASATPTPAEESAVPA